MNKQEQIFSLATYNIQMVNHPEDVIKNIKQMKEDGVTLFCLQEIREVPGEPFIGNVLKEILGKNWESAYFLDTYKPNPSHGLGIFWDSTIFTLEKSKELYLPLAKRLGLIERLVARATGLPGMPSQRKALICQFSTFGKTLRVTNLHLDWQQGTNQRLAQLEYVMEYLRSEKEVVYECLCGDFNTNRMLRKKRKREQFHLDDFFGVAYNDITKSIPWTIDWLNADYTPRLRLLKKALTKLDIHYYQKLDYIWVKNMEASNVRTLVVSGSDHLPVVANLKVK